MDDVLLLFWNYQLQTELSIETGCLPWGIQVVIPEKLQQQVLEELHKDYPRIVHRKAIARRYNCWEGVDKDIESLL